MSRSSPRHGGRHRQDVHHVAGGRTGRDGRGGQRITRTGARLPGTVNPKGLATTYTFEYGKTTAYGTKTTAQSAGTGATAVAASADVSNLTAGTVYHYRISATNSAGTSVSTDRTFTTSPPPAAPAAVTGSAAYIAQTYAQLNGTVNAQGTPTTYLYEYGTTTALGSKTDERDAGSGTTAINRVAELTTLTPNTTYYYRVVAKSSAGTTVGTTKSFKTLDTTGPLATTGAASAITRNSATLAGTINPRGELTGYRFEYGLTTSYGQATPDGFLGGTTKVTVSER